VRLRLGPGPVFVYEWLTAARRWQVYALRAGFIGAILIGLCFVWSQVNRFRPEQETVKLADLAAYGQAIFMTIVWVELSLVLLAAPAATAGAVCLDKARGTLEHMLVTDLSNAEIVLGKLAARLVPVLGLVACVLPVVALTSLLGGIDPLALFGAFLVAIGCAFVGCSLAMALSVYGRKTHEVLMLTYLILIAWIIAPVLLEIASFLLTGTPRGIGGPALADRVALSNPYFLALAPYQMPAKVDVGTYLGFLAVCLAVSAAPVVLATARVRRVALRQAERPASGRSRRLARLYRLLTPPRLPGPSLEGNPVAWREWHRSRPSLMMRVAWGLYAALGLFWILVASSPWGFPGAVEMISVANAVQVSIGLLLLSVASATSLAEERVRGSLDVLLSTPISTRSILAGKWWGGFRCALNVVIWPAATTAFLAYESGYWIHYGLLLVQVMAYGAAITSLGLAVATWVSRLGRAIALCISIYVVLAAVWPILVVVIVGSAPDYDIISFLMGDPPYGAMFGTMPVAKVNMRFAGDLSRENMLVWTITWIVVHAGVAGFLYLATLATFDHCLGRIPDDGARPPALRPGRSSLTQAELLALVPSASGIGEDLEDEDE
jgi:ABC-type transport system involved in multi-copper enzyme maturation permease subunit